MFALVTACSPGGGSRGPGGNLPCLQAPFPAQESEAENMWSFLVAQWVKDLTLSLLCLGSLRWHRFSPWPGNFHVPQVQPERKRMRMFAPSALLGLGSDPWEHFVTIWLMYFYEVRMIYSVVWVSSVPRSGTVLYIYIYIYVYIHTHIYTHILFQILFPYTSLCCSVGPCFSVFGMVFTNIFIYLFL